MLYGECDHVILQKHAHPFGLEDRFMSAARALNPWIRQAEAVPVICETRARKGEARLQSHMNGIHQNPLRTSFAAKMIWETFRDDLIQRHHSPKEAKLPC